MIRRPRFYNQVILGRLKRAMRDEPNSATTRNLLVQLLGCPMHKTTYDWLTMYVPKIHRLVGNMGRLLLQHVESDDIWDACVLEEHVDSVQRWKIYQEVMEELKSSKVRQSVVKALVRLNLRDLSTALCNLNLLTEDSWNVDDPFRTIEVPALTLLVQTTVAKNSFQVFEEAFEIFSLYLDAARVCRTVYLELASVDSDAATLMRRVVMVRALAQGPAGVAQKDERGKLWIITDVSSHRVGYSPTFKDQVAPEDGDTMIPAEAGGFVSLNR